MTDEDLLRRLIEGKTLHPVPVRHWIEGGQEVIVGIGKDHHAVVRLDPEALKALFAE